MALPKQFVIITIYGGDVKGKKAIVQGLVTGSAAAFT
jgi:hypothetical protein